MIIDILLGAVVPFILIVVSSYLIKTYRSDDVVQWVKIAVKAAEQIFEHGDNKAKFEYVETYILEKFKISKDDLEKLIESAVYELKE